MRPRRWLELLGSSRLNRMTKGKCHQGKSIKVVQAVRDKQVPGGRSPQWWAAAHSEILSASVTCRTGTLKDTEADGIWWAGHEFRKGFFSFLFNPLREFVTATQNTHGDRIMLSLKPFLGKTGSSASCIHADVLVSCWYNELNVYSGSLCEESNKKQPWLALKASALEEGKELKRLGAGNTSKYPILQSGCYSWTVSSSKPGCWYWKANTMVVRGHKRP